MDINQNAEVLCMCTADNFLVYGDNRGNVTITCTLKIKNFSCCKRQTRKKQAIVLKGQDQPIKALALWRNTIWAAVTTSHGALLWQNQATAIEVNVPVTTIYTHAAEVRFYIANWSNFTDIMLLFFS